MNYRDISSALAAKLRNNDSVEFINDFHVVNWPVGQTGVHTVFVEYLDLKWRIDCDVQDKDPENHQVKVACFIELRNFAIGLFADSCGQLVCLQYSVFHQGTIYPELIMDFEKIISNLTKESREYNVLNIVDVISRMICDFSNSYYTAKNTAMQM